MRGTSHLVWLFVGFVALAFALRARVASAHDFDPGALILVEVAPGRFQMRWVEPVDSVGAPNGVRVGLPDGCRIVSSFVECGARGLRGTIAFEGMRRNSTEIVVSVRYLDGDSVDRVVRASQPALHLERVATNAFWPWVLIGFEHVWTGLDHVAFVVGLFLLAGDGRSVRRLLWTVTAFTLAHSVTLGLAATKVLTLSRLPVEACIAASVVLVAREATHRQDTLSRRFPWLVALLFGLVHGLGFAGALDDVGLARSSFAVALAAFNVGVELAQGALVLVLVLAARGGHRYVSERFRRPTRTALVYALGCVGAYWFIGRAAEMLTAS